MNSANFDTFASLGRDLAATSAAETAAHIILEAADGLIGWDACYLILYDPERAAPPRPLLTIDTIEGKRIVQHGAVPDKPTENMLKAIQHGGFLSTYEGHFPVDPSLSFGDQSRRTLSQMFVAVATASRTIDVLSIQSYQRHAYDSEQLDLLKNLASHCAGALERIWAQEALEDLLERMKWLHEALNEINASHDVEQVCKVVYETVERVMPCNDFVMDGYDSKTNEIVPLYAIEHPRRRVFTDRYFADHGLAGEIVRTKKPILFNSIAAMDASGINFEMFGSQTEQDPTESILAVPMLLHGEIYGMVSAQSYQKNAYSFDDLYLLETLASHAAIAIENARLFDSIRHLADTDPLTATLNRRRFFELAETEFELARARRQPFSVILLDVDDFKKFNDQFGHKIGDFVLIQTSEVCKTSLRAGDIFGRLGGEEFVVALPGTQLEQAMEVATRLCRQVYASDYNMGWHAFNKENAFSQIVEPISITVSVGVATYDDTCPNVDILIDRADQAMYAAKNSGRNQVCAWRAEADG
jgi:diguanylate cyclase (GGDEF)-like protein